MKIKLSVTLTVEEVKSALKNYISTSLGETLNDTSTIEDAEFDGKSLVHDIERCEVFIHQEIETEVN